MTDTFDAGKLSKYLGGESDSAVIAQFYNETSQLKTQLLSILISPQKESRVVDLYNLRNGLHGLLQKYANIEATEQLALAEDVDFANLDAGIDTVYKSALLSHTLSTDASTQNVKDIKQYVKLMKEAHEKKAKS